MGLNLFELPFLGVGLILFGLPFFLGVFFLDTKLELSFFSDLIASLKLGPLFKKSKNTKSSKLHKVTKTPSSEQTIQ